MFSNGWVALTWLSALTSASWFQSIADMIAVHGHGGMTRVIWIDGELMICLHRWLSMMTNRCAGWPLRDRQRGVDVQTCVECGKKRDSKVQFGVRPTAVEVVEHWRPAFPVRKWRPA